LHLIQQNNNITTQGTQKGKVCLFQSMLD